MGKKSGPPSPAVPPRDVLGEAAKHDGFVADAPICAILSIDGETAVSGRVTPMGNIQVNLVSTHYNVALRMPPQMLVRMHAGLTALVQKLGPPK
jgi:hypothetical protein